MLVGAEGWAPEAHCLDSHPGPSFLPYDLGWVLTDAELSSPISKTWTLEILKRW